MTGIHKSEPEWTVGPWRILNPHLTVKLGFVFDSYKLPQLSKLWTAAEDEAKMRLGKFEASDLFHQQERQVETAVTLSTRWYTPAYNRVKKTESMI